MDNKKREKNVKISPSVEINQAQLQSKCQIIQQLRKSQQTNYRQILSKWPSHNLLTQDSIIKRQNKTMYVGQIANQTFHGYGLLIYFEENTLRFYQGQFQNKCKHGSGIQYIDGDIYIGNYVNNKPQDEDGVFIWKRGDVYFGSFVNGLKHGKGRWDSGGNIYYGDWKFNKPQGEGTINSKNSNFKGSVKNGFKHGQGMQIFKNGDRYQGSYANGKPSGNGTYYWNNGAVYHGSFQNGLRFGYGKWKYGSQQYQGYYLNDKRNGEGLHIWDHSFYQGIFQNDLRHGFGEMHWNQRYYYRGYWKEGFQEGQGEVWEDNKLVESGIYQKGQLISNNIKNGQKIKPITSKLQKYEKANKLNKVNKLEQKKVLSFSKKAKDQDKQIFQRGLIQRKIFEQKNDKSIIYRNIGSSFDRQNKIKTIQNKFSLNKTSNTISIQTQNDFNKGKFNKSKDKKLQFNNYYNGYLPNLY